MSNLTFDDLCQINDYNRKIATRTVTPRSNEDTEKKIRRDLVSDIACELRYTVRGNRGEGKTNPRILNRVRFMRSQHTASIARQNRSR